MRMIARIGQHPTTVATVCFSLLAIALAGPALLGRAALGPDTLLDWDPLYRVGAASGMPYFGDLSPIAFDLPKDLTFARGLHAGRIDAWNALASGGAPLWADEVGPFFPLKLPFYLVPSRASYDLFLTLRLIFAAVGAYCLARRRGLGPIPAIAAGASFELSGMMIAQLPYAALSAPYVLPWVILGSFAIAEQRTATAAVGAGLALGLAANGGHPTMILLVFAGYAAAIAGHMARSWRSLRTVAAIAAWAALSVVLGLALAAPALLPLAELASVATSYKFQRIGSFIAQWKLSQSRQTLAIGLFAPGTFQYLYTKLQSVMSFGPLIGELALVLAVAGMLAGGLDAALLSLAILGIALTTAPPGLGWIYELPGASLILPHYAWTLVVLVLTQAVGSGVRALSNPASERLGLLSLGMVIVASASLLLVSNFGPGPAAYATLLREALAGRAGVLRLLVPPIFAALSLAICFAIRRTRLAPSVGGVLVALLVLEQLTRMLPATRQEASRVLTSPPSPAVQFLQGHLADREARFIGVPESVGSPMTPMLFGLPDLRGVSSLPLSRYVKYLQAIDSKAAPFTVQAMPAAVHPLLNLAAVRYVARARLDGIKGIDRFMLSPPGPPIGDNPDMPVVYEDDRVIIHENRRALPRAQIAHHARAAPDQAAAEAAMRERGTRPQEAAAAANETVVLEPAADGQPPPTLESAAPPAGTVTEIARIVDAHDPDRVVIEASLATPGVVVLADSYYPGWVASVDNVPTPIYPANLLFRAVFVPAGAHTVEFRYQPHSLRYGTLASLLAGSLCVVLLVRGRRRADRRPL